MGDANPGNQFWDYLAEPPTAVLVVAKFVESDGAFGEPLQQLLDLSPQGIINQFNLRQPNYSLTAAVGHFKRACFRREELSLDENLRR